MSLDLNTTEQCKNKKWSTIYIKHKIDLLFLILFQLINIFDLLKNDNKMKKK